MESIVTIICDEGTAGEINEHLREQEVTHQSSPRGNLDGSVAEWVVVASVAIQALPAILTSIKELMGSRRISSLIIRKGDDDTAPDREMSIEISNPSKADIEKVLDDL